MKMAIAWCANEYKGLPEVIKADKIPGDWIFETMAKWDVSKRTAIEYLNVASAKIKIIRKEEERERERIAYEDEKIKDEANLVLNELVGGNNGI